MDFKLNSAPNSGQQLIIDIFINCSRFYCCPLDTIIVANQIFRLASAIVLQPLLRYGFKSHPVSSISDLVLGFASGFKNVMRNLSSAYTAVSGPTQLIPKRPINPYVP